jgi:hypothetical protein
MVDPPATSHDARDDTGAGSDREPTGTPRWVKVFGLIALVVVVLFVVVLLIRGGEHGPGRHSSGGGSDTAESHVGPPPELTHVHP